MPESNGKEYTKNKKNTKNEKRIDKTKNKSHRWLTVYPKTEVETGKTDSNICGHKMDIKRTTYIGRTKRKKKKRVSQKTVDTGYKSDSRK